jgi:hypothetical protein
VLPNVLHGELRQERLHSQRVELAECRDARSEDDVAPQLGHVLAVVAGENTTKGAIECRLRCGSCGARFPRVGLLTPPRMTHYKG